MGEPLFFPQWNRLKLDLFFHLGKKNVVFLCLEYQKTSHNPVLGSESLCGNFKREKRDHSLISKVRYTCLRSAYTFTSSIRFLQMESRFYFQMQEQEVREPYLKNARPDPTFFNRAHHQQFKPTFTFSFYQLTILMDKVESLCERFPFFFCSKIRSNKLTEITILFK